MPDWPAIIETLEMYGVEFDGKPEPRPVSGGDINAAWRVEAKSRTLFVKTALPDAADRFEGEAAGLAELASADAVRVPEVIACGMTLDCSFIALEWLKIEAGSTETERELGKKLAALHRHTAEQFGWHRNNAIGRTPQHNRWTRDWAEFFRDQRLMFRLQLAASNGYGGELQLLGRRLADGLPAFFAGYKPMPSLLHGDLWGGNWGSVDGHPVIFDPAVYYGDRETDLAMTRLFGGFGAAFYSAYEAAWPSADGSAQRQALYQLYHVLNHLNLFGSGYLGSAQRSLQALCARL